MGNGKVAVIFDGTCGPCTRLARFVQRRDGAGRFRVIHNQAPGVLAEYGLSRVEADRSVWVVEPDGTRFEGATAINRILSELGLLERFLTVPYRVPMVARAEDRFYGWFAAHRPWFEGFGVEPPCSQPGADCAG